MQEIAADPTISPTTTLTVDIGDTYSFPHHITPKDLRPHLVWWDDGSRLLWIAELTVCFEGNFGEAALRKSAKYTDLVNQVKQQGYSTILL